jgi:hypothetical protein
MRGRARRTAAIAAPLALAGAAGMVTLGVGCKGEQPCDGFAVGNRFAITIVDSEEAPPRTSGQPCGTTFDLTMGQVLQATVVDSVDSLGFCYQGIATYAPFGKWTWSLTDGGPDPPAGADLVGNYKASNGTCSGQVKADLEPSGGPTAWAFSRAFVPAPYLADAGLPGCPTMCWGTFAASVQRHQ